MSKFKKQSTASRRANRVRAKVSGTAERPRVSVFTSLRGMFVQFIDDFSGKTIISVRVVSGKGTKTEQAAALGKTIAEAAKSKGITKIVFDRGARQYHGRVKALAEALRAGGLKF